MVEARYVEGRVVAFSDACPALIRFRYLQSGKRVMDLFRARGWTTIITNNLVGYVLSFTTFTVAVVSGGVAMLIERCVNARYGGQEDDYASYIFGPVPGFGFWSFG